MNEAAPARQRLAWMDLMRGTAIVLVLLSHAMALTTQSLPAVPAGLQAVDSAFRPLRMPAMVFLSGMLLAASMRKGRRVFTAGKLRNIAYPFALWTVIYVIALQRDGYGDPETAVQTIGRSLLTAPSPLWFLLFLTMFYANGYLLLRAGLPHFPLIVVALVISFLLADETRPSRYFFLFAFFLLGDWVARHPDLWERALGNRVVLAGCAVLATTLVVVSVTTPAIGRYDAEFAVAVLAAIVVLARAASTVSDRRALRPIRLLGQHSLVPYVVHYPVMVATAAILVRFVGLDQTTVVVALTFLAGLVASAVAMAVRDRVPAAAWLFAVPRRPVTRAGVS